MTPREQLVAMGGSNRYWYTYRHIQTATAFVSKKTGEVVALTHADKDVLHYLIDKVSFYQSPKQVSEGKKMIESLPYIATQVEYNDRTVSRAMKKLIEHGLVTATIQKAGVGYLYTDVDVHQDWQYNVTAAVQERMKPNPINVQAPVVTSEAFADTTPDVGMPDHMNAPVFDYSDVFSQMQDSDNEPRVSVVMVEDEFDCELPFG